MVSVTVSFESPSNLPRVSREAAAAWKGFMGYTALLRWANPPASTASPIEMVLQCVLDQYNITPGPKQTVSLRTYRAAMPDSRLLTVINFPMTEGLEKVAFLMTDRKPATATTAAPEGQGAGSSVERYKTLAVSPASNVVPLLNALSSPFVIGVAKAAKASAATTAEKPVATALTGQHLLIHTIQLSLPPAPQLAISLRIHTLALPHTGLILEAELPDGYVGAASQVATEFLESCLPCPGGKVLLSKEGGAWDIMERGRRTAEMLARCLREEGVI